MGARAGPAPLERLPELLGLTCCSCSPHRFFELFDKYGGYRSGKLKLKKPKQLQVETLVRPHPLLGSTEVIPQGLFLCQQEVLDIARLLLAELGQDSDCEIEENKSKLEQLKMVLEM